MENNYFNIVPLNNYCFLKTIEQRIEVLMHNGICFVPEINRNNFIEELKIISSHKTKSKDLDKEIASLYYLEFSEEIIQEISWIIQDLLKKEHNIPYFFGNIFREKYRIKQLTVFSNEEKEKLIIKLLKKLFKRLKYWTEINIDSFFEVNEHLAVESLEVLIELFYRSYSSLTIVKSDFSIESRIKIRQDIITHVSPPGSRPNLNMYKTGEDFLIIQDLLSTIDYFKDELKKIDHWRLTKKTNNAKNYIIENIDSKINRFPLVFKDAYNCEMFFFILSFYQIEKTIIFSYFFEVFQYNKGFKKNIKPSDYLMFINNSFGLSEVRIRKDLSSKKYNNYVNSFLKFKNMFDLELSVKTIDS